MVYGKFVSPISPFVVVLGFFLSTPVNIYLEGKTEIAKKFKVDKYLILISKCVFLDYRNKMDISD